MKTHRKRKGGAPLWDSFFGSRKVAPQPEPAVAPRWNSFFGSRKVAPQPVAPWNSFLGSRKVASQPVAPQPDPALAPQPEPADRNDVMLFVNRHGNSCNNIVANIQFWEKKSDPGLSVSGVLSVLQLNPPHVALFDAAQHFVYVSACVRTWMTAVLLYGKKPQTNLRLQIAPFLKEDGTGPGDMPAPVPMQIRKFETFTCFLKKLLAVMQADPTVDRQLLQYVENCSLTRVEIARSDTRAVIYTTLSGVSPECDSRSVDAAYVAAQTKNLPNLPVVPITTGYVPYALQPPRQCSSPIGRDPMNQPYSECISTYDPHGIVHFYEWLAPPPGSKVFAVAHSHMMQACLKNSFRISPELTAELTAAVFGQNAWGLHIRGRNRVLIPAAYSPGIPKTDTSTANLSSEYICAEDQGMVSNLLQKPFTRSASPQASPARPASPQPTPQPWFKWKAGRRIRSKKRKHNRTFKKK